MRFVFEHDWYTWSFGVSVTIGAPSRAFELALGLGPVVVGVTFDHVPTRTRVW